MTRPIPEHGTRARYVRGCRCDGCTDANYRYCKAERTHIEREGRGRRLDPAPVRARIHYWESLGYSHEQIAKAAGVARRNVDSHSKGLLAAINPDTARKIMAARLGSHDIPTYLPVDATGTRRRMQALMVLGHPLKAIASETGHWSKALSTVLNGHRPGVRQTTADDIAALYERWRHTPGSCVRTRKRAAAEGWHGPLAWGDIDNPNEEPEAGETTPLTRAELAEVRKDDVLLLADAGALPPQIADRVDLSLSRVREIVRTERPILHRQLAAIAESKRGNTIKRRAA